MTHQTKRRKIWCQK